MDGIAAVRNCTDETLAFDVDINNIGTFISIMTQVLLELSKPSTPCLIIVWTNVSTLWSAPNESNSCDDKLLYISVYIFEYINAFAFPATWLTFLQEMSRDVTTTVA